MFSEAEVQPSRARLVVECREAPESEADLRDPACRAAVLGHLEREFGIETIVLSHYVEKQYGSRAMTALRGLLGLARLLAQFSSRPPAPDFPQMPKKQIVAKCAACPFHPKALFGGLRDQVTGDLAAFHGSFLEVAEGLCRYREPGCRACTTATGNDLVYLFGQAVAFGEDALRDAPAEEVAEEVEK